MRSNTQKYPGSTGDPAMMAPTRLPYRTTMSLVGLGILSTYVKLLIFTTVWAFYTLARSIHVLA